MATRLTDKVMVFGDAVTAVGTVQKYPLGTLRDEEGKKYRYVKLSDTTVTAAAGALCYAVPTDEWVVTGDTSDQDSGLVKGAFMGAIANNGYGWIQRSGYLSNLKKLTGTGFGWAKGDVLYAFGSSTSDGKAVNIKLAATTKVSGAEIRKILEALVGHAAAAVSSTTATGGAYLELE